MPSFENRIPEEKKGEYSDLTVLLRHLYHQKQKFSESEQLEALTRVEERLARRQEEQVNIGKIATKQTGIYDPTRLQSFFTPRRLINRMTSALAIIVVVGVLISGILLFQTLHIHSSTVVANVSVPVKSVGTSIANVTWNNLTMSTSITPGPYFLGELIAADFSLTNRTQQTLTLAGTTTPGGLCNPPAFSLVQTEEESPRYMLFTMPVQLIVSCSISPQEGGPVLAPGQTITGRSYTLLTNSGDMTFVGQAFFSTAKIGPQGGTGQQRSTGPLAGHFPTFHIHVMPQVPTDKVFQIRQEASRVIIDAPTDIHLLDQTYIICQDLSNHPLSSGTGHSYWASASMNILQQPECPGSGLTVVQWKYAVGAVGYEVVQGQHGQYSGPHVP